MSAKAPYSRQQWLMAYCRHYNAHFDRELAAGRLTLAKVHQGRAAKAAEALRTYNRRRRIHGPTWPRTLHPSGL